MEQGGSAAGESGGIDFSTDIDLDQVGNRNRNLYCTLGQSGVGEQHVKRRGHSHLTVPVLPVVHLGGSQPRLLKLFEHVLHIAKLPPAVGGGHWRRVQPLGLRADHDLAQRSPGKQLHPAAECSAVQPPKVGHVSNIQRCPTSPFCSTTLDLSDIKWGILEPAPLEKATSSRGEPEEEME